MTRWPTFASSVTMGPDCVVASETSRAGAIEPVAGTDCVMSFAATVVTSAAVSTTPSGLEVR